MAEAQGKDIISDFGECIKQWLRNSTSREVLNEITVNKYKDVYHSCVYKCTKLEPAHTEGHGEKQVNIYKKTMFETPLVIWKFFMIYYVRDTYTYTLSERQYRASNYFPTHR